MNGRTNAKNGAGAIRNGCAVLEVRAPVYSQITATRSDGLVKKQDKGYIDLNDSKFQFYYIIIQKFELSNLNWVVTATDGLHTVSTNINISTAQYINIALEYRLDIIKNGKIIQPLIASRSKFNITEQDNGVLYIGGGQVIDLVYTIVPGNLNYTKIIADMRGGFSWYGGQTPGLGYSKELPSINTSNGQVTPYEKVELLNNGTDAIPAGQYILTDIEPTDGNIYVWLTASYSGANSAALYIINLYLSY